LLALVFTSLVAGQQRPIHGQASQITIGIIALIGFHQPATRGTPLNDVAEIGVIAYAGAILH